VAASSASSSALLLAMISVEEQERQYELLAMMALEAVMISSNQAMNPAQPGLMHQNLFGVEMTGGSLSPASSLEAIFHQLTIVHLSL
jgi:hypothetical protein